MDKKHIELILPMDEFYINANEELLKQVWLNLLDNAIKFSPDYGTVEVQIKIVKILLYQSLTTVMRFQKEAWIKFSMSFTRLMNLIPKEERSRTSRCKENC